MLLDDIISVFKDSPNASLILRPDAPRFTIAAANDQFLQLVNRTLAEIVGLGICEAFHRNPDDTESKRFKTVRASLEQALYLKKSHKLLLQQYDLFCKESGKFKVHFWNCDTFPILDNDGNVEYLVLNPLDVTSSIQSPENRHKLLNYLPQHSLLNDYPDAVFSLDLKGNFLSVNKALVDLAECSEEELLKTSFTRFLHPDAFDKTFKIFHKAIKREIQNYEINLISAKGTAKTLSIYNLPIVVNQEVIGLHIVARDLTEKIKAQVQLSFEKERYKDLFNMSPLPQWVYDPETLAFLNVNQAAINHYGYSRKEFLSMTIRDIRPDNEVEILEEIMNGGTKPCNSHQSIVNHRKKNGEIIRVRVNGNRVAYNGKHVRLVLAVDETEKIKAIEALEASEQRFKALVQDGSDLITVLNEKGIYQYVSPTSHSVLGIQALDLLGKNMFKFIHEDDKQLVADKFMLLKDRHRVKVPPFRFRAGNGQFRWIETIITDMSDDPAILGIIANSRDVTQRIENELKTEQSIQRFNTVSKATSDAIWDLDLQEGTMVWNKGLSGIFGHKQMNCKQDWFYSRVHADDLENVVSHIQDMISKRSYSFAIEYRFKCSDGSYKYVFDRAFIIFDKDEKPVRIIGSMQDISERINYIKSIEEQNSKLHEIAWIQSHIVRAPLARIMGLTKLIYHENTDDTLKKELLEHLDTSSTELDEIIKDIVSKTEGI